MSIIPEMTVENPSMGLGLQGISDWTTQQPFLNVFKTARPWIGHTESQWGGLDPALTEEVLDENGYLTRMPDGATTMTSIFLTELPAEMTSMAGTYRVTYEGEGQININGAQNVRYEDGEIWFDYTPRDTNLMSLDISSINPDDYVKNIAVVHENNIEAYDAGEMFNREWLELVDDFRVLRMMDWMATNNSPITSWDERATEDSATWAGEKGAPIEVMVELANQTGTDPWFTIPHLADEDYIREFTTYVRDNLDPDLKPYFEYSNEVWNWQFDQAQYANAQGQALWPGQGDAWVQFYGMKSAEMAGIIDSVYGPDVDDRVFKVITTQTGYLGLEKSILEAPNYVEDTGNPEPHTLFNSYAVTGYFGGNFGGEKADTVLGWISESYDAAVAEADEMGLTGSARSSYIAEHRYDDAMVLSIRELRDGSVTGDASGTLENLYEQFEYHSKVAADHDLRMVMYEGGTHVVGLGNYQNNDELTAFFTHLNSSEEMAGLYGELIEGWHENGGTLFNAFVDVGSHGKYGSWGAREHLDDDSPRWKELVEKNAIPPSWEEIRAEGAFVGSRENSLEGPADPEEPEEPVDPVDPPVEPEEPPVGPQEPEEPPVQPEEPPVEPEVPVTPPVDPVDPPVQPEEPVTPPVDPEEPEEPVTPPVEPEEPPVDPEEPVTPTDPTTPENPDEGEEEDPQDEDSGKGGACFVATAAYGHRGHPEVAALRHFRDNHLVRTGAGRAFVRTYWIVGPRIATMVGSETVAGRATRAILGRAVRSLRKRGLCD